MWALSSLFAHPKSQGLKREDGGGPLQRIADLSPGDVPWIEQISWEPRAQVYHNFLTPLECNHLITLAAPHMKTANVVDKVTGKSMASQVRTSTG